MGSYRLPFRILTTGMFVAALLFSAAATGRAQDTQAPAHIAVVDGSATVERDGQSQSAIPGLPIVPGDHLRTTRGRAELLFPDGSALDVDEFTSIDVQSPTLLRLNSGRLILIVAGASDPANAVPYQIDTPVASAFTEGPGEYRVALYSGAAGVEAELAVFRGTASLSTEQGSTRARAGERTLARDLSAPSYAVPFNSARFDAFDRWSMARRDARTGTQSAQYLPPGLSMYSSTFDRYGRWSYEPSYGHVWYPAVAADWRPYYLGYWSPIRSYGWTWIGFDIWGWPTYHYGRWGYISNRWFWIPGRHWAPAWVHWAYAPGYVGWCPLGFNGAPVFALSIVGGSWPGWTFLNTRHFGGPVYVVNHYAVTTASIPAKTPFIQQSRPPVAIPRHGTVAADGTTQSARRAIPRPGPQAATVSPSIGNRSAMVEGQSTGTRTPIGVPPTATSRQGAIEPRRTPAPTERVPAYRRSFDAVQRSGVIQGTSPDSAEGTPSRSAPPVERARTPASSYTPQRTAPPQSIYTVPSFATPRSGPSFDNAPVRTPPPSSYTLPSRNAPEMSAPRMERPSFATPRSAPPPSAPPSMGMPSRSAPPPSASPAMGTPSRSAPMMPSRSAPMSAPPSMGAPSRAVPAPSAPPPAAAPAGAPAGARTPRSQ